MQGVKRRRLSLLSTHRPPEALPCHASPWPCSARRPDALRRGRTPKVDHGRRSPPSSGRRASPAAHGLAHDEIRRLDVETPGSRRLFGDDEPPPDESGTGAPERLAADGVEDEIDPSDVFSVSSSGRSPRLRQPPDILLAQLDAVPIHVDATPARELSREVADSAGCAVDDTRGPSQRRIEQPLPCTESRERDGCGHDVI